MRYIPTSRLVRINHNMSLIKRAVLLAASTGSIPTHAGTQPLTDPSINFQPYMCVCVPPGILHIVHTGYN